MTTKFKTGDIVVVTGITDDNPDTLGKTGIVEYVSYEQPENKRGTFYGIDFKEQIENGHDLVRFNKVHCKIGQGWDVLPKHLRKANPEEIAQFAAKTL